MQIFLVTVLLATMGTTLGAPPASPWPGTGGGLAACTLAREVAHMAPCLDPVDCPARDASEDLLGPGGPRLAPRLDRVAPRPPFLCPAAPSTAPRR